MKNIILSIVLVAILSSLLHGAATRVAFIDPHATARGNAFVATADSPSAVFYNAAGLTQLEEFEVQAGFYAVELDYSYRGPNGSAEVDDRWQLIPHFFAAYNPPDSTLAVGIGVYMPFGLHTDWGQDSPFNAYATKTTLTYIKVHPVLAWQVTETLSVAAGPTFDRTDIELNRAFAPMPGASMGELRFDGNDNTVGYSLAARWQPTERHAFGVSYQAKTTATYTGTTSTPFGPSEPSSLRLVFPESIVVGYSFRPTPKWNLEVNVDWTNWDRVKTPVLRNAVSPDVPLPLEWESSFIWEVGATRYFDNGYRISAGYTFVENSVPDRTFNPAVPDSDRHFIGLGVGRRYDTFTWQITYQFTIAPERTVSGSNPAGPTDLSGTQTADGRYRNENQAVAFSLSARF